MAQTRKDLRLYLDEVGLCYGETVKRAASDALAAGATPRIAANPVKFPLNDRIVRIAKGVIVHSNWSRRRVRSIAPGALVEVIPHHITETAVSAANTDGPVRIASFGLITPNKGIARALRALSALLDRHDFKYTLVSALDHQNAHAIAKKEAGFTRPQLEEMENAIFKKYRVTFGDLPVWQLRPHGDLGHLESGGSNANTGPNSHPATGRRRRWRDRSSYLFTGTWREPS